MNERVLASLITEAMEGLEEARLGFMKAAKALYEAEVDPKLHGDVLMSVEEVRDQAARLTEYVVHEEDQ